MKRTTLLAAVAGVMLAGCSSSDELTAVSGVQQPADATAQYVGFTSTTVKAGLSRAGWEGSIRDAELKSGSAANGFGVTAFFTGTENYNNGDHKLSGGSVVANNGAHYSNFMYNEHVYWDGTANAWKYDILKPWPNGNATADDEDATGDTTPGADYGSKVSFFAYAPYVSAASGSDGIIAMSDNAHEGNPTITYQIAADGKNVDLLWGTCPTTKSYQTVTGTTQSGKYYNPDGTTPTGYELASLTGANGDESLFPVNINLVKQQVGEKVSFLFKHALSKVGGATDDATTGSTGDAANKAGLLVQLDIDKDGNITGGDKPDYTKVLIRDVQVECTKQMVDANSDGVADGTTREDLKVKGTLDLATGRWLIDPAVTGSTKQVVTSLGTTDAALIAASTARVNALLAEPAGGVATGQTAHTVANWNALPAGVLTTPQNVYGTSDNKKEAYPMVFIPGTIPVLKFTVDYVVRVKDTKLKDNYTEVKQRITKTVEFTKAVELNKKYNILMHLGLTNIKFEATVDNWDTTNDGNAVPTTDTNGDGIIDEKDGATQVHLPINVD